MLKEIFYIHEDVIMKSLRSCGKIRGKNAISLKFNLFNETS